MGNHNQELLEYINSLSEEQAVDAIYDWKLWARPNQLPPGGTDWFTWLILAGRGFGKTRVGAEWIRNLANNCYTPRLALVGPTAADVRDTMIEGESGILACSPPSFRPTYIPSKRKLEWPNGVVAFTYSSEEPERLRGPQHGAAWCDEAASWKYAMAMDMLDFGLRLGERPIKCITTTPKPTKFVKDLLKANHTFIVRGSTYDNKANLAPTFLEQIVDKYEGTRLGQQELHAQMLEESEGALWKRQWLEDGRVDELPEMVYFATAIDPAVTSDKKSNETGIISGGIGVDGRIYVTHDDSLVDTPENWTKAAVDRIEDLKGNTIVAESNNGGDLIVTVIKMHETDARVQKVWASQGKYARGEPISMLYEQGKVSHVGYFPELEDELCTWDVTDPSAASPNRLDALVWLVTHLKKRVGSNGELYFGTTGESSVANEFGIRTNKLTEPDF